MFGFYSNQLGCLGSIVVSIILSVLLIDVDAIVQRIIIAQNMLSTINDVTTVARKVWPDALLINVGLSPTNSLAQKMYRVSAIGADNRLFGRLDAPSLNKLKALLEQRLTASPKECAALIFPDP